MNCPYQNKNERTTECGRNRIHGKGESKIGNIGGIMDELYLDHKRKYCKEYICCAMSGKQSVAKKNG